MSAQITMMPTNGREAQSSTMAIHAGVASHAKGAPVAPPMTLSSTFVGGLGGDDLLYAGFGNNPTQVQVAEKMAALEGTEASAVVGSGMAAIALTLLSVARAGDHIVASRNVYGLTRKLLEEELPDRGIATTLVDPASDGNAWAAAVRDNTRLLYLELPTNPTLRVYDPRIPAALARSLGLVLAVDATFATPINVRMHDLGATAIIHSATKYLGGHSDLVGGVVSGPASLVEAVKAKMKLYGAVMAPHTAWMLDRSLRTLDVRVRRQNETALALARWFHARPEVARVIYPGLPSHPDHALAAELFGGFGGIVSIIFPGGARAADVFMDAAALAIVAPSLGGVETLLSQPRFTSHMYQTAAEREAAGIPDGMVRISVGLEDLGDLKTDFSTALQLVAAALPPTSHGQDTLSGVSVGDTTGPVDTYVSSSRR